MWMTGRTLVRQWLDRPALCRTHGDPAENRPPDRPATAGATQIAAATQPRLRAGACVFLAGLAGSMVAGTGPSQATSCLPASPDPGANQQERAAITHVRADGTLVLRDGRLARLAGVYLDAAATPRLKGRELRLVPVQAPDRWGRLTVLAFDRDLLQIQLLAEGLAAVWPEIWPENSPGFLSAACAAEFARAEAAGRRGRKGLWARPGLRLDAHDPAAVLARNGRFAIVEGRVESLGKARDTRYLNFGARWTTDFTVTISSRIEDKLAAAGVDPARMKGARVRVRGVVLAKDGPHIEVTDPAQIEWAN